MVVHKEYASAIWAPCMAQDTVFIQLANWNQTLNLVSSTTNVFKCSFFVAVPMLQNYITISILSQPITASFKHKPKQSPFCNLLLYLVEIVVFFHVI